MRKKFGLVLLAELIIVCLLQCLPSAFALSETMLLEFPFVPIGNGLRELSLSGSVGNGLALALWCGIGIIPLAYALAHIREKERVAENVALVGTLVAALVTLYLIANPDMLMNMIAVRGEDMLTVVKQCLCIFVWSFFICYLVFRLVRMFRCDEKRRLLGYLQGMLRIVAMYYVAVIGLVGVSTLRAGDSQANGIERLLQAVGSMEEVIVCIMCVAVVFGILRLLDGVIENANAERISDLASRLSRICGLSLSVIVVLQVLGNVLTLVMMKKASSISFVANLPLAELVFVVIVLFVAKLSVENKQLTEDNEMFI